MNEFMKSKKDSIPQRNLKKKNSRFRFEDVSHNEIIALDKSFEYSTSSMNNSKHIPIYGETKQEKNRAILRTKDESSHKKILS